MIALSAVTKTYGTAEDPIAILKGIDLEVRKGEFVAIMGPSGSGKSTLMHIIGALDVPSSGSYRLDGRDVATLDDDRLADIRREKIGFVFQSFHLLPRTTAVGNVALPLMYAGVPAAEREERAKSALRSAGFDEARFGNMPSQLSGGQAQRVAIARALANDPPLILADEPTGNLDTRTGEIVLGTFQRLNAEQGRTIVLITHEPDVADHADRVVVIRDGLIVDDRRNATKRAADATL